MSQTNQKGFTLVEIAIVLVIIGLLLGGVLKGQELIASAKVKSQVQQLDGIAAAFNSYVDKYGVKPGDDDDATGHTGDAGLTNGNGNGGIAGAEGNQYVWEHMQAAGLISGYTAVGANNRFANKYGLETFVDTNYAGLTGDVLCTYLPGEVAAEIDRKYDNDDGADGSIRRNNESAYNLAADNWICQRM